MKNKKFEKVTSGFIGKNAVLAEKPKINKPLPKVTDRVGYPVAIGKMLPRILARIAGKS